MSALSRFLSKHGEDMGKYALGGAVSAAVGVPVAYGVKKTLGTPEQDEFEKVLKEVRSVKRKQDKMSKAGDE